MGVHKVRRVFFKVFFSFWDSCSLANRFTHCDSIRDLDRNRITIGRIDSNRFEVVIHSDFVVTVNQNLYHHALTLGA